MRYRHVIWDWNGTLLDDVDLCVDAMNVLLLRRSLPPLTRERYLRLFGFPVCDYYGRLGFDPQRDSFTQLSIEFIEGYNAQRFAPTLQPGADAVLAAVQHAGMTQSILSAYQQDTLREVVQHFGLAARFVRLNGLGDIYAHSKVELGRTWMKELGLPPDQVLLVGDTLHDLEVAEALGSDCVLIAHGHHPADRLRERARHVVGDLPALASWLGLAVPVSPRAPAPQTEVAAAGRENPAGSTPPPANRSSRSP